MDIIDLSVKEIKKVLDNFNSIEEKTNIVSVLTYINFALVRINNSPKPKEGIVKFFNELEVLKGNLSKDVDLSPIQQEERAEVERVKRKLKLWSKRPNQKNTQILSSFIMLQNQSGKEGIKLEDFRNFCIKKGYNWFDTNYNQMKTIAEKNHGKVFDERNGIVRLWQPVREAIESYKEFWNSNL